MQYQRKARPQTAKRGISYGRVSTFDQAFNKDGSRRDDASPEAQKIHRPFLLLGLLIRSPVYVCYRPCDLPVALPGLVLAYAGSRPDVAGSW